MPIIQRCCYSIICAKTKSDVLLINVGYKIVINVEYIANFDWDACRSLSSPDGQILDEQRINME